MSHVGIVEEEERSVKTMWQVPEECRERSELLNLRTGRLNNL